MAKSTGPILAVGGLTALNDTLTGSFDLKVLIATGAAALVFSGLEKAFGQPVVMLSYLALVTAVVVPLRSGKPTPAQSIIKYVNG